ncbi:MAG: MiaB/RimO family radical SAM methylthiotransferase [Kiritimatiellae bacterium]|nr:MiaB/RimO family radical SAM methylthiotransferase [Kiritimatiellia bacterium]
MTVGLVSLGCAKNAADLEVRLGRMLSEGWTLSSTPDNCDVLVVNTCAFIESAREEAEREIRRALKLKRRGAVKKVVVAGCYPERYPDRASLFAGVDSWEGVPKKFGCQRVPGLRLSGKAFAYLKIAEGCSHRCAYCAIPSIRGKYRSRPMNAILKEARDFVRTGVRELNIIAQDPMLYGVDFKRVPGKARVDLVTLLKAIDRIRGNFAVRVLYSYPNEITDGFLDWMRTSPRAMKYIDVPLQHTDPDVLKAMARGSAVKASLEAAERIRAAVPGVTLRTTVMTGFPGETAERFARMLSDVKRMKFDHLGVFAYSPEEGTPGAEMKGRPSMKVAQSRALKIMAAQKKIWAAKAKSMLGTEQVALVVAPGVARLESQAPDVDGVVRFPKEEAENMPVGEFVKVRLVAVEDYDFIGEWI